MADDRHGRFAAQVLQHRAALQRYLSRFTSGAEDVEDLVQETLVRVYGLADYRAIESPRALLLRIGHNLAIERRRRAQTQATEGAAIATGPIRTAGTSAHTRPDLEATTIDGVVFHAREPGEKRATAIVFFSPWCETYLADRRPQVAAQCRDLRELLQSLSETDSDFRWLAVASGIWTTRADLMTYENALNLSIPLALDETSEWFRSFGIVNVPTIVVTDPQGSIMRRIDGKDVHEALRLLQAPLS